MNIICLTAEDLRRKDIPGQANSMITPSSLHFSLSPVTDRALSRHHSLPSLPIILVPIYTTFQISHG